MYRQVRASEDLAAGIYSNAVFRTASGTSHRSTSNWIGLPAMAKPSITLSDDPLAYNRKNASAEICFGRDDIPAIPLSWIRWLAGFVFGTSASGRERNLEPQQRCVLGQRHSHWFVHSGCRYANRE